MLRRALVWVALTAAALPAHAANPSAIVGEGTVTRTLPNGSVCTGTAVVSGGVYDPEKPPLDQVTRRWTFEAAVASRQLGCVASTTVAVANKEYDAQGCVVGAQGMRVCIYPWPRPGQDLLAKVTITGNGLTYTGTFSVHRF